MGTSAKRLRFSNDEIDDEKPKRRGAPDHILFKKGREKTGGRIKGKPNRTTRMLKDAIEEAMNMCGSDRRGKDGAAGYLAHIAWKHPDVFIKLLEKLLPHQLTGAGGAPLKFEYTEKSEILVRMKERGLPVPISLLAPPAYQPMIIDAEAEEITDDEDEDSDIDRVDAQE